MKLEQRPQLVIGRLLDSPYLRSAGDVHKDIDPTEPIDRLIDSTEALRWIGHVKPNRVHAVNRG